MIGKSPEFGFEEVINAGLYTWPVPVGSTMARILWNSASPLKW